MTGDTATIEASARLRAAQGAFGDAVVLSEPFAGSPPLWIEPVEAALRKDIDAAVRWMGEHKAAIEAALLEFGAIVWRGFPVASSEDFAALLGDFDEFSQGYAGGTTVRSAISGKVMEATRTPEEVYILLHQEMSYLPGNPRLIALYCKQPSAVGGETPICDMRGLLEALPEELQHKLVHHGARYIRNMRDENAANDWRADPDLRHFSWQFRFGSDDRASVTEQMTERGAEVRWQDHGGMTFWNEMPAVTTHPITGQRLFFNQIYAQRQHALSVGPERAARLDAAYADYAERPYVTGFGNGDLLSDAEFLAIHAELERRKVSFRWQAGDVVLVENKLTAHGREPFSGERDVQVMLFE